MAKSEMSSAAAMVLRLLIALIVFIMFDDGDW
jgi:hypothetical protein